MGRPVSAGGACGSCNMRGGMAHTVKNGADPVAIPEDGGPGSEVSLAAVCARYRAPLVRYFVRRGHAPDIAEDCTQEVFVRIAGAKLETIENVEAYLFTVASSVAIDHGRKMRARCSSEHDSITDLAIEGREVSPARVLEDKESLRRLDRILDELPPRTREIFLLNRLDGLSYTQLAVRYGLSIAAIEKQMSKALAHLRRRFNGHD